MKLKKGKIFADKHGPDAQLDPHIKSDIQARQKDGSLTCAVALDIAQKLQVSPSEVGKAIDLMNLKLAKCQLGLFGYGKGKKVTSDIDPDENLKAALGPFMNDGMLPCIKAFEMARELNTNKISVGNACEALKIRVKQCQLGAF